MCIRDSRDVGAQAYFQPAHGPGHRVHDPAVAPLRRALDHGRGLRELRRLARRNKRPDAGAKHAGDQVAQDTVSLRGEVAVDTVVELSLIHISEPTRLLSISYAVFCLKKK